LKPKDSSEFWEGDTFNSSIWESMKQDAIAIVKRMPSTKPNHCEYVKIGNYYMLRKVIKELDWLSPDGQINFLTTSEPLYRRLLPPPEETVDHGRIIAYVIDSCNKNGTYIEYGVRSGANINVMSHHVAHAHGVDIASPSSPLNSNVTFYNMTTSAFKIDVLGSLKFQFAFIDADHAYSSVIEDFEGIYNQIDEGGYIFLHDTYPCAEHFLSPAGCHDCYKTPIEIKKRYPNIEILTLPLNPGVSIIRKVPITRNVT
jgi:hypothetical protein